MSNLQITKERVKAWSACADGYHWFLDKFPQGGEFAEVYAALQLDKKYDDSVWLADKVFPELDAPANVQQTVLISGADKAKIEKTVADGAEGTTTGYRANAATTGEGANAATTGEGANAATTGDWANAATTGEGANAATTGEGANAATTGYRANAATTGDRANAATTGAHAVAAAFGIEVRAKSSAGGAIVLVCRNNSGELLQIRASKVGENGIKPDVFYALSAAGEFVEVSE
jgi:hypothetical protein